MNPRVSIIILNWNGWRDTIECLESLYQITYPNYDAIVVDNGSEDESIEKITEYCKGKIKVESKFFLYSDKNKPIKIIEYTREEAEVRGEEKELDDLPSNRKLVIIKNEKNYGFAEGNNIAIRYALKARNPDYVLLLNNDTVVDPEFLGELVEVAESDPKIGIVGPKIYYYDFNGRKDVIWFAGGLVDFKRGGSNLIGIGELDIGQCDKIKAIDYAAGTAFLIKKIVVSKIGLLDPKYFAYYEEVDWNVRAKNAGFKTLYVPSAKIWHKISASIEIKSPLPLYYGVRNKLLFMKKHAIFKDRIFFALYFTISFLYYLFILLVRRKKKDIFAMLYGFYDFVMGNYGYQRRY